MEMKFVSMRAVLMTCLALTAARPAFAHEEDSDPSPFPRLAKNFACTGQNSTGLKTEGAVQITIRNISLPEEDLMLWTETAADGRKVELEMTIEHVVPYTTSGFKILGAVPDAWAPGRPSPSFQLVVLPSCPNCFSPFMATDNKQYRYQAQLNCSY